MKPIECSERALLEAEIEKYQTPRTKVPNPPDNPDPKAIDHRHLGASITLRGKPGGCNSPFRGLRAGGACPFGELRKTVANGAQRTRRNTLVG